MNVKKTYEHNKDNFIYENLYNKEISFCKKCKYPVISIKKPNFNYILIICVNLCFEIRLNKNIFNRYTMDNIVDLYNHNCIHTNFK